MLLALLAVQPSSMNVLPNELRQYNALSVEEKDHGSGKADSTAAAIDG
jgi:hypothetical protein